MSLPGASERVPTRSRVRFRGRVGHFDVGIGLGARRGGVAFEEIMYEGHGLSLLRDKNRFVLPVELRNTIKETSGSSVVRFASHETWPCLVGFGEARVRNFKAELAHARNLAIQMQDANFDAQVLADSVMTSYPVPFDNSGRFVLPEDLASINNVTNALYFRGNVNFFTVWSPETLFALEGPKWRMAQANCRTLMDKELAKASRK